MLSVFWFAVSPEKEGATHYSVSSLHHIRYAIKRILQANGRDFDYTVDPKFSKSQRMFKEACKELKRKGFGHVKHTDEIKPKGRSSVVPWRPLEEIPASGNQFFKMTS